MGSLNGMSFFTGAETYHFTHIMLVCYDPSHKLWDALCSDVLFSQMRFAATIVYSGFIPQQLFDLAAGGLLYHSIRTYIHVVGKPKPMQHCFFLYANIWAQNQADFRLCRPEHGENRWEWNRWSKSLKKEQNKQAMIGSVFVCTFICFLSLDIFAHSTKNEKCDLLKNL